MLYHFTNAIVRYPGESVVNGLSKTGLKPNLDLLRREHVAYVETLSKLGLRVYKLDALEQFPDSVFIEDPALTFEKGAILLRPGAKTRMGEEIFLKPTLLTLFDDVQELRVGKVDGGDILLLKNELLIGLSSRTDKNGAEALKKLLLRLDIRARIVATPKGVLHLKSDCSILDEETIFATPKVERSGILKDYKVLVTPNGEAKAANLLRVNNKILISKGYQKTAELLAGKYDIEIVDVSEVSKLDAGLSCMSLRW